MMPGLEWALFGNVVALIIIIYLILVVNRMYREEE